MDGVEDNFWDSSSKMSVPSEKQPQMYRNNGVRGDKGGAYRMGQDDAFQQAMIQRSYGGMLNTVTISWRSTVCEPSDVMKDLMGESGRVLEVLCSHVVDGSLSEQFEQSFCCS